MSYTIHMTKTTAAAITDITEAYGNPAGRWVRVADIAAAANLTPTDIHNAITELLDDDDFRAEPDPIGSRITDADRYYAPVIGGEPRHLIFWA